jgi:tRNA-Thr(GGU) m(6)t(6)A37 methyltransferase TsaA
MTAAKGSEDSRAGISPRVIGRIRTPFVEAPGTPIQSAYAEGSEGSVIVDDAFADALDDIEGFERVWLVYWMDRVSSFKPHVVPYRDTRERGLFATRSPCRPNPIGMSVVRLLGREGGALRVADVDILDDTPLLDIKPYVPEFDAHPSAKAGWFEECGVDRRVADGRFHAPEGSKRGGHR